VANRINFYTLSSDILRVFSTTSTILHLELLQVNKSDQLARRNIITHSPQTKRWCMLVMPSMRIRKISWRMMSCYYPCWQYSHTALADYKLLEMPGIFGLYIEQSVQ